MSDRLLMRVESHIGVAESLHLQLRYLDTAIQQGDTMLARDILLNALNSLKTHQISLVRTSVEVADLLRAGETDQ